MGGALVVGLILLVIVMYVLYGIITAAVQKGIENSELMTRLEFQAEQNGKIIELLSEIRNNQEKQSQQQIHE